VQPPESPTTARELDFDDDNDAPNASTTTSAHETVMTSPPPPPSKSPKPGVRFSEGGDTEIPPPKPPRPVDPRQQAQATLVEAFPDTDSKVIQAVLVASGWKVEPAFNALLSMSDPNFKAEDAQAPPPQPPRPSQPRSQLEQDEIYARQLAEHYQTQSARTHTQAQGGYRPHGDQRRQQQPAQRPGEPDREHSFFDDDLPEIRKNIEQGFKETQKTVTGWITNFTKKLDGEPDDYDQYGNPVTHPRPGQSSLQQRQNFGPSQSDQLHGIRKSTEARRSADHNRYDADNRVLGDDFAQLQMHDNEGATQHPSFTSTPHANTPQHHPHEHHPAPAPTPTSSSPPPSRRPSPAP